MGRRSRKRSLPRTEKKFAGHVTLVAAQKRFPQPRRGRTANVIYTRRNAGMRPAIHAQTQKQQTDSTRRGARCTDIGARCTVHGAQGTDHGASVEHRSTRRTSELRASEHEAQSTSSCAESKAEDEVRRARGAEHEAQRAREHEAQSTRRRESTRRGARGAEC